MTAATRIANLAALQASHTTLAPLSSAPPTITGSTSAPAWGTLYGVDDLSKFTLLGASYLVGTGFPGAFICGYTNTHQGDGSDPTADPIQNEGARVRFTQTGSRVAIKHGVGPTRGIRVKVDGEYIAQGVINDQPGFETFFYTILTFTTSATRNYEVEMTSGAFEGVHAESAPSAWPAGLTVLVNSDSMGSNIAGPEVTAWMASLHGSLGSVLAEYLGQPDCWHVSVGQTGFYSDGDSGDENDETTGPKCTFGERVATDVIPAAPDVIIELGGLNDGAASYAVILGLVTDWLDAIITALPDVLIFMTGPLVSYAAGNTQDVVIKVRNAKQAAAALYPRNVWFLDNMTEEWANADNEDDLLGADPPHLSLYGHNFFAERIANEISDAIPTFMTAINGWDTVPPATGSWSIQINADGTWEPI